MPARLEFDLSLGTGVRNSRRRGADDPLRILVIGDFAGRRPHDDGLAERRIHAVDLDEFDRVMARLAPRLELRFAGSGGAVTEIGFDCLESFHPDSLYQRLEGLAALRDLRSRLRRPDSFEQAARELLAGGAMPSAVLREDTVPAAVESVSDLTGRLLGARPDAASGTRPAARIEEVIRRLVEPHVKRDPTAGAAPYLTAIDEAATAALRQVLGAPEFKRLEAGWRSLRTLVDRLELGESMTLAVLDTSKAELVGDLVAGSRALDATGLYRRIVEGLEGSPPSVIVLDFEFGAAVDDLRLLARAGAIGARVGAAVVGAAAPTLLGVPALVTHPDPRQWESPDGEAGSLWQALRTSPVAASIGLALPRVLLRQPYGPASDAIDAFDFEEIADTSVPGAFLWGNPAYACALLLAQAFAENGWAMAPGDVVEVDDLPACIVSDEHGRALQPCAEILLSERAVDRLLAAGLMPLASDRARNACRLVRFQSIAEPARALSGPWSAP